MMQPANWQRAILGPKPVKISKKIVSTCSKSLWQRLINGSVILKQGDRGQNLD